MAIWDRFFGGGKGRTEPAPPSRFTIESVENGDTRSLTTEGVALHGSRELRIDGVPSDLDAEMRDLLHRLADLAIREKYVRDGEMIAGPIVDETLPVIHAATLRLASRTTAPGSDELFRVVDLNEPVSAGFPVRLAATHLAATAHAERGIRHRLRLLRRSVALFAGEPARFDTTFSFERGENVGNWFGWSLLGETLVESGSIEEGLRAIEQAVLRCPAWAADFATHVAASIERTGASPGDDPRLAFWTRYAEQMRN